MNPVEKNYEKYDFQLLTTFGSREKIHLPSSSRTHQEFVYVGVGCQIFRNDVKLKSIKSHQSPTGIGKFTYHHHPNPTPPSPTVVIGLIANW